MDEDEDFLDDDEDIEDDDFGDESEVESWGDLVDDVMGIKKDIPPDYFIKEGQFPIGTRKPWQSYKSAKDVPEEDWVYFPINKKEITSYAFIAMQGAGKTTLMKRFIGYEAQCKTKIICFDPKGEDLALMKQKRQSTMLHPKETAIGLNVKPYIPAYVQKLLGGQVDGLEDFATFSDDISDFNEIKDWTSLGISPTGVNVLLEAIRHSKDPKQILKKILGKQKQQEDIEYDQIMGGNYSTRQSLAIRISNLISGGFFNKEYKKVPLKRHWKRGEIPVISYFSQEPAWISASIGKMLLRIRDYGYKDHSRKMIVLDDAKLIAGKDMDQRTQSSAYNLVMGLALWRKLGMNMMYGAQTPDMLNEEVLDMSKYIFVGKISNADYLKRIVGDREVVEVIKKLDYRPDKHISQFCMILPNKVEYVLFYPIHPRVGNVWV